MLTLIRSSLFVDWIDSLTDDIAKARILNRLASARLGLFGDCEAVGEGISEMRIHVGAGYRVYFIRSSSVVYVLLCGGSKSTQKRDIMKAKKLVRELKKDTK
jgi:putative addiction module killer protein